MQYDLIEKLLSMMGTSLTFFCRIMGKPTFTTTDESHESTLSSFMRCWKYPSCTRLMVMMMQLDEGREEDV